MVKAVITSGAIQPLEPLPADWREGQPVCVEKADEETVSVEEIDRDFPLTWFAVRKKVEGHEAVQFERLVGELTAFLPSGFLRVERHGVDGRFQPVKDPEEMSLRLPEIVQLLEARQVL